MMAVWVPTGAALRLTHRIAITELPFDSMRRHGICETARSALFIAMRKAARWPWKWTWPSGKWYAALTVLMAPAVGFAIAAMPPLIVVELFTQPVRQQAELGGFIGRGTVLAGVAGAFAGTYVWIKGLAFVARPAHARKIGLPPLVFPDGLSNEVRDFLAFNIYWRSCLFNGCVFAAAYPWFFIAAFAVAVSGNSHGSGQMQSAPAASFAITLVEAVPALLPAMLVSHAIERRLVHAKVCKALCDVLKPGPRAATAPAGSGQGGGPSRATLDTSDFALDPFGRLRDRLAEIAAGLDGAAALTDRRQKPGLAAHPAATLMRAVAKAVRQYLSNRQSLRDTIPDEMKEMLTSTLVLFAAHHDPAVYDRLDGQIQVFGLAGQVQAFDSDGNPAVGPQGKPPGRVARLASRVFTGIPNVSLTVSNIATLVVIAAAVILVLRHAVTIEQFMQYLK
jgi:hypothetical protein